ncbi:MAG: DUF2961 domain-containing protein [Rikenellaceae bacterium]|nr:DUF2961 domain-containing protein [Rikenellaceae bacterium]
MKRLIPTTIALCFGLFVMAQPSFNGLNTDLGNLYRLSNAESRSISPENFTGEKGKGGMAIPTNPSVRNVNNSSHAAQELGQGWKVNPKIIVNSKETFTLAQIEGSGAIQHIWMTTSSNSWRWLVLRIYWDDEKTPSVECPLGDFFCQGWNTYSSVVSQAVCVNPARGFNCYWQMPFRKGCKMTIENINPEKASSVYYQVDYTLTEVPQDAAYFHAQFRRTPYCEDSVFTILDGVKGQGHFVGVYMAWGLHNNGWWGEGEIKFYLDGDKEFPTICGTGLEDYFCGAYDFTPDKKRYEKYCTPYAGLCQVIEPDGTKYNTQQRFGLYRWHIVDPIRFKKDIRITIQDLGWKLNRNRVYLAQHSDIATTAFWYQAEPHATFPKLPSLDELAVE